MRIGFAFCILVLCIACSKNIETTANGDWANNRILLSVSDSLMIFSPLSDRLKEFSKEGNVLSIADYEQKLKITKRERDSIYITLISTDSSVTYRLGSLRQNRSDSIRIERVIFSALGCYGTCPVMNFEINESGECYYEGIEYTSSKGNHVATDQIETYRVIVNKITSMNIEMLDTLYAAPWTDDATALLKIYYDDKVFETQVYGNYKEPIELRLLILYLRDLPNYLKLQPTATAHKFETTKKIPKREKIEFLPPK